MPQMMPINWMILFLLFILIFLIFNIMNYFIMNIKLTKNNNLNKKLKMNNFNWKW
uniref:ATP synthase F0 subunit 8 n=1 Tax=Xanthabraxas hemionata TaxID=2884268 RepID=UPI001EF9D460|nr:ATP synthase F0 subunit 8 [Xanthabraxas hemionata]UHM24970.1 ATP synthase F0 subunit 8 [Xanthabraxas hemionata]